MWRPPPPPGTPRPQPPHGTLEVPKRAPQVKPRVHERSRVRVRVREQQAVAPFAILGFLAAAAIAVVLLMGYIQLNSVYAETVQLRSQLTELENAGGQFGGPVRGDL